MHLPLILHVSLFVTVLLIPAAVNRLKIIRLRWRVLAKADQLKERLAEAERVTRDRAVNISRRWHYEVARPYCDGYLAKHLGDLNQAGYQALILHHRELDLKIKQIDDLIRQAKCDIAQAKNSTPTSSRFRDFGDVGTGLGHGDN